MGTSGSHGNYELGEINPAKVPRHAAVSQLTCVDELSHNLR